MTAAHDLAEVRRIAERCAAVIASDPHGLADLGVPEEALESVAEIVGSAAAALREGDYDIWKWVIATIVATPGVVDGGRSKWRYADIAGDVLWRFNRDAMKNDCAKAVDELLDELFPR